MEAKITVIPGDGIGPEIVGEAKRVLEHVGEKFGHSFRFTEIDMGGCSIDKYGEPLTDENLGTARNADAVLLGAVGGNAAVSPWYKLPPAKRPEAGLLKIRKALGLYANLRPALLYPELSGACPLKPELVKGVDLVIVRELIGGIYFGDRCESEMKDGAERAWDLENYSVPEVDRIARLAFETAKLRRGKVTSVDKSNVLATSRLWRRTVEKAHADYSDVALDHLYVDNCAMQLAVRPTQFDVICTGNLFGDILSDEAAVIGGSIGMMPSASIGEETSLFEPIHGSAPDIAGKGIANPIGTILSAAMLLRYSLKAEKAADAMEAACDKALADGFRTPDLWTKGFTKANTESMTQAILDRL